MNRSFLFISFFILSGYIHAAEERGLTLALTRAAEELRHIQEHAQNQRIDQRIVLSSRQELDTSYLERPKGRPHCPHIQEARNKKGMTALHYAIKNYANEAHIRSVIKSFDCNDSGFPCYCRYERTLIDKKGPNGRTALHWVFDDPSGARYVMRRTFLISGWFKTQRLEENRILPLELYNIIAAYFPSYASWQVDSLRILLDEGAEHTIRDDNGETPRDLALQQNNEEAAQILRDHGDKQRTYHEKKLYQLKQDIIKMQKEERANQRHKAKMSQLRDLNETKHQHAVRMNKLDQKRRDLLEIEAMKKNIKDYEARRKEAQESRTFNGKGKGYNTDVDYQVEVYGGGKVEVNLRMVYYGDNIKAFRIEIQLRDRFNARLHSYMTPDIALNNKEDRSEDYSFNMTPQKAKKVHSAKMNFTWALNR